MDMERGGECALESAPQLRLVPAEEAVRLEARPIEVKENEEIVLTPTDPDFASCFVRVRLESHRDLQLLGLVPRGLPEEKVRRAIEADDAEAYDVAGRLVASSPGCCGCSASATSASPLRGSPLRPLYNSARKRHNPALAAALSDHYRTQIAWDAPLAAVVRKWEVAVRLKPEIIIVLLDDIVIQRSATLTVASWSKSLLAWNIWIHKTGRLVARSSYLKVWANSITQFSGILSTQLVDAARKMAPIWRLTE